MSGQEKFIFAAQAGPMDQRHHQLQPTLIDPALLEEAGRAVRLWLDRLLHGRDTEPDTSIAWEDGEPHDDPGRPPSR